MLNRYKSDRSTDDDKINSSSADPAVGMKVERFFNGLFSQLDISTAPHRERLVRGVRASSDRSNAETVGDSTGKQPLPMKSWHKRRQNARSAHTEYDRSNSFRGDFTRPLLAHGDDTGEYDGSPSRSGLRRVRRRSRAERDAEEARGHGSYCLHAVIGQGSFGRIHLASWQEVDGVGEGVGVRRRHNRLMVSRASKSGIEHERSTNNSRMIHRSQEAQSGSIGMVGVRASFGARGRSYVRPRQLSSQPASDLSRSQEDAGVNRPRDSAVVTKCGEGDEAAGRDKSPEVGGDDGGEERSRWRVEPAESEDDGYDSDSLRLRALKSVCKRRVTEKGLIHHMETELKVLMQCSHPYIVSLHPGGHFQTSGHLHLVLDYCPGGDLFSLLGIKGRLNEPEARVCAAQIALALRHLHDRHIVYRDLKPENVCLDSRGRAILVDFSLAKTGLDRVPGGKTYTFCGSAAYVAPEMLAKTGHDTRVDLWSLGCVIYEVLVGAHPFRRPRGERTDRLAMFERIQLGKPEFPPFLSASALSILQGLLVIDPNERLGFPASFSTTQRPIQIRSPENFSENFTREVTHSTQSKGAFEAHTPAVSTKPSSAPFPGPGKTPFTTAMEDDKTLPRARDSFQSQSSCLAMGNSTEYENRTEQAHNMDATTGEAERWKQAGQSRGKNEADVGEPFSGASVRDFATQPLLLEHCFFGGMPGWGGPGSNGAWDEVKLAGSAVMVPDLRDELDVRHFDPKFTSQTVELILQGHPHKGGPTPAFESFDWRPDGCIESGRAPGFLGSMASALWC